MPARENLQAGKQMRKARDCDFSDQLMRRRRRRGVCVRNGRVSAERARARDWPQLSLAWRRRSEKAAARRSGLPENEQRRLAVMRECQRRLYEKRRVVREYAELVRIERCLGLPLTPAPSAPKTPSRAPVRAASAPMRPQPPRQSGFIEIPLAEGGTYRIFCW
jgi:hypothetical protein